MRVDKLVRDGVPDELRGLGRTIIVERVAGSEYMRRLKEKLIEESGEVFAADAPRVTDELVDVVEVVIALASVHGVSLDALLAAAAEKRKRLGGLSGIVLVDNGLPERGDVRDNG